MPAGRITALRAQVKDAQRVNVFIDGEFALGVSLSTITKAGLYVGRTLNAEEYTRLEQLESADKAFQAALHFLEARPRSVAEVRERLIRKAYAPEAIDTALARLAQLELIDDAAFARFWVENRQTSRPRGISALRDELRRKGIAADVAAHILSDDELTGDEPEHALTLARAALHKYTNTADRPTFLRRMGGYLQRRGFSFEVIRPIVDQLWNEAHGDVDDEER